MSDTNCNHQCASCGVEGCSARTEIAKLKTNEMTSIKKTIAIISGKGGVGKSLVTSLLAKELTEKGYKAGILDADVTGPSIPKAFGILGMAEADEHGIYPRKSKKGVAIMSVNLLLPDAGDPVLWRGPLIAGLVGQMYTDVYYGELDYLLIDMPPGTGDVPLTVFQQIPVNAAIIVTSPQDLVSLIVGKSIRMALDMNVPLLGVVTNMAYMRCPHCNERIDIYGEGRARIAATFGLPALDELPIDPLLAASIDRGSLEDYEGQLLKETVEAVEKI